MPCRRPEWPPPAKAETCDSVANHLCTTILSLSAPCGATASRCCRVSLVAKPSRLCIAPPLVCTPPTKQSILWWTRAKTMSFSSLVQDLSLRDSTATPRRNRPPGVSVASSVADDGVSRTSHISRGMSYASTAATSVSISGSISSQLHSGYSHSLARSWQAERQLTKVRLYPAFPEETPG